MSYQNCCSDFTIIKVFRREGASGALPVPERIRLTYYVDGYRSRYVAEKDGGKCVNCSVSDDGMSLSVYLRLSEKFIGKGSLMEEVQEFVPDEGYPGGGRLVSYSRTTGIVLWNGNSTCGAESSDVHLLTKLMYGYSAYQLAVQHGFAGTEEEWLESLGRNSSGLKLEFDVITSRNRDLKMTYQGTGENAGEDITDRFVGLRFCCEVPEQDHIVQIYIYNQRKGKKYIPCGQCTVADLLNPYNGTLFRTLPKEYSLMGLFMKAWLPCRPEDVDMDSLEAEEKAGLWMTAIKAGNFAYDIRRSPKGRLGHTKRNKCDCCSLMWSASFGIRIFSPDKKAATGMKTFRIGILKKSQGKCSFSMKNKI